MNTLENATKSMWYGFIIGMVISFVSSFQLGSWNTLQSSIILLLTWAVTIPLFITMIRRISTGSKGWRRAFWVLYIIGLPLYIPVCYVYIINGMWVILTWGVIYMGIELNFIILASKKFGGRTTEDIERETFRNSTVFVG